MEKDEIFVQLINWKGSKNRSNIRRCYSGKLTDEYGWPRNGHSQG